LRGKENEIELYALTAAVSATGAGSEVRALSSRTSLNNFSPAAELLAGGLFRVINLVSSAGRALPLLAQFRTYRCVASLGDQIG
jgi:hypothetical protein